VSPIISGGGGSAFNGGTITAPLVIDVTATPTLVPLSIRGSFNNQSVDFFQVVNTDALGHTLVNVDDAGAINLYKTDGTALILLSTTNGSGPGSFSVANNAASGTLSATANVDLFGRINAGALPTTTFSSGTGKQVDTNTDRVLTVPFTLTNANGTLKVELSPDNNTYSTLVTLAPAVNAAVEIATVVVPAGWYVKLTATNVTIGTATYY